MAGSQSPIQANMLNVRDKPQKVRQRASIACNACRGRRVRCVVFVGQNSCTQCKDSGEQCIIKHNDERRKPNSKAYVNSLRDRIAHLESLLEEKDGRAAESRSPDPQLVSDNGLDQQEALPSSSTNPFDFAIHQSPPTNAFPAFTPEDPLLEAHSPANSAHSASSSNQSTISRLLSTKGHLSFDQLSGRLRWFGPTTNCHVYSDLAVEHEDSNRQAMEQQRRTHRVMSTLPEETQSYLMQMFWQYYNSVIHVIHRGAFEDGMNAGQGQFYSPFLHICIMGIGYRHADKSRPDIMKISLPGKESTLHREAKYMLDYELERPGDVTSIQALLLLGDLECGVGRDNLGWLISGMAMRILFDAGLHLAHQTGLSQLETEIRRMTLWACVIYDRYWALFLGRPTALKPEDIEVYRLAQQFERLGSLEPAGPRKSLEKQIYEALLDLMELAGQITEVIDKASKPNAGLKQHVYATCSALNYELETWYARLPRPLRWSVENIEGAPFSYFLLHQQYHAAMILLHRHYAQYDDLVACSHQDSENCEHSQASSHFATLSRMTCTNSAGKMAQIFWQHRKLYDTRRIFVTGLQHAGTAAIALIAAVTSAKDRISYCTNMRYLECLAASINDMSETYQPAERMSAVLKAVLEELKATRPPSPYPSTIPARRGSSTEDESENQMPVKRHQSGSPNAQKINSQLLEHQAYTNGQPRWDATYSKPSSKPNLTTFIANDSSLATAQGPPALNEFGFFVSDSGMHGSQASWAKFETIYPFLIDQSAPMSGLGRPESISRSRSAWMSDEIPSVSPMPSSTGAANFGADDFPRERLNAVNASRTQDIFTSNTNLDFLSLLDAPCEMVDGGVNVGSNEQCNRLHLLNSLDTPKSQILPIEPPSPGSNAEATKTATRPLPIPPANTRNHSCQSSKSRSNKQDPSGDPGFSTTTGGFGNIWKEMMRSTQTSAMGVK